VRVPFNLGQEFAAGDSWAIERSWAIKIVVILAAITGVALFIEEMWRLPHT